MPFMQSKKKKKSNCLADKPPQDAQTSWKTFVDLRCLMFEILYVCYNKKFKYDKWCPHLITTHNTNCSSSKHLIQSHFLSSYSFSPIMSNSGEMQSSKPMFKIEKNKSQNKHMQITQHETHTVQKSKMLVFIEQVQHWLISTSGNL